MNWISATFGLYCFSSSFSLHDWSCPSIQLRTWNASFTLRWLNQSVNGCVWIGLFHRDQKPYLSPNSFPASSSVVSACVPLEDKLHNRKTRNTSSQSSHHSSQVNALTKYTFPNVVKWVQHLDCSVNWLNYCLIAWQLVFLGLSN